MHKQAKRYSSIRELWQRADHAVSHQTSDKVNVYGVVVDCRAPYETRGPDLRCEVEIADETSLFEGNTELKTLKIYCFEKNPADCIPFRAFGDVLRAHRIHVNMYTTDATKILQGVGRFYSTFMLWSGEGQDFEPVATRDAVPVSQSGRPSPSTQIVTDGDKERIRNLRQWSLSVLANRCRVHRPRLRTIAEILSSPSVFSTGECVDVLCIVDNIVTLPDGNVEFFIHDGSATTACHERVFVQSRTEQSSLDSHLTFANLCPSWKLRPIQRGSWAMIRDIHPSLSVGRWLFLLSIGQKTSTLIWYPSDFAQRQLRDRIKSTADGIHFHIIPDAQSNSISPAVTLPEQVPSASVQKVPCDQRSSGIRSDVVENFHVDSSHDGFGGDQVDSVSTIRKIRTSVGAGQSPIHDVFVRIRSCTFPSDLRFSCRLVCASCGNDIVNFHLKSDQTCSTCVKKGGDGKVGWQYRVRFLAEDRHGDRIDMWAAGELSKKLFHDVSPVDFFAQKKEYASFRRRMSTVLGQDFFKCRVLPYEYEDEHGIYRVACQLVAC